MGKGILFIVAAALLGGSYAMYNTQQLTLDLDATLSEEHESQVIAREMARSAMNMAAGEAHRDWQAAVDEINEAMNDVEHEGGAYQASATWATPTTMDLDVTGAYGDKAYRIKRSLVLAGPLDAAVVFDALDADVTFGSSDFLIDGTDRRPPSMGGSGTTLLHKAGFVTNTTEVFKAFGSAVGENVSRVRGVNDDGGSTGGASIRRLKSWDAVDLDELYRELTEDHTFQSLEPNIVGDPMNPRVIGTSENPVLAKVSANTTISGTVVGYGLLLVEGDLNITGNFTWEGIVLVYEKEDNINLTYGGEATIYGSLIAMQRGDWVTMPEEGRLKVTYKYSSAGFGSEVWIEPWGESPDLLFERGSNRDGDQMDVHDVVFPKGQRINFFINVEGCPTATTSCWPKHYWDHYALRDDAPSGRPYGRVVEVNEYKWEIQFEDLPEGHPWEDWDYNDQVIEVEVIPEDGVYEESTSWWEEGTYSDDGGEEGEEDDYTINYVMGDEAKVLYSAEAIARIGTALDVQVIKDATRIVTVDNWEGDPSDSE